MNALTAVTVFAVIFPAELPDKSLIASLVLATRFRPVPVWLGVAGAFAVHVGLATAAGGAFGLLPHTVVQVVVAALFAVGAAVLLLGSEAAEEERGEREAAWADPRAARSAAATAATAFAVVFVGEWGDLTQIATANLAARYRDPVSVAVGATLALWTVAALGIAVGNTLLRVVPLALVRRITGLILAALAVLTIVDLLA